MGIELSLFILVGGLAVLAAVLMLVSDNAVHSALFLIVNFACVAFMYLMLDATFLAMVQVTVYAGAIMVLFLFVIMLLGAERMTPEREPRFPWLTPAAVGMTLVLLLLASVAIIQSDIEASEPESKEPYLRVIHAVGNGDAVDIYLRPVGAEDSESHLIFTDVEFEESTDYKAHDVGEYEILVMPHEATSEESPPLYSAPLFLNRDDLITLVLMPELDAAAANAIRGVTVNESLATVERRNTARLTVVNAFPCQSGDESCVNTLDIADRTVPSEERETLAENLEYGAASESTVLERGDYTLMAFPQGTLEDFFAAQAAEDAKEDGEDLQIDDTRAVSRLRDQEISKDTSYLWVVTSDFARQDARPRNIVAAEGTEPAFGGPTALGQKLFVDYMLPFQIVGVLLLTAMVGVIVLTKQFETPRRKRNVRRMANVPGNPTVAEYLAARKGEAPEDAGE